MDQTQKLLQSVYENAQTGADASEQLLPRIDNAEMRTHILNMRNSYLAAATAAERELRAAGGAPRAKSPMSKAGMWVGTQLNTMIDKTPSHIADIVIQGATMGVITMTRDRNALPDANDTAHSLAANFITTQQSHIDSLKAYL